MSFGSAGSSKQSLPVSDYPQIADRPFLSVVIPAFNEETRILDSLEQISDFLSSQDYSWEVVIADDGSTDSTASLVEQFIDRHPGIRLLRLPHGGKGWAVRNGMLNARGRYRFMCDADLSMPIDQIGRFFPEGDVESDVAIGSREAEGANRFGEPNGRHLLGRLFSIVVARLAVPNIRDTQCGFKLFSASAADELFSLQTLNGFGFDVEILYLAHRRGINIREIPIDWYYRDTSKVRPWKDSPEMLLDVFRVRWNHLMNRYDAPRALERSASDSHDWNQ